MPHSKKVNSSRGKPSLNSISRSGRPKKRIKVYAETRDWKLTYNGVTAMAGASHWQFTAYKSTLQQFLPFDMTSPMGQVRQLDKRMNDAGLLRLMVSDPLAMNMSNTLGYLRGELGKDRVKRKRKQGLASVCWKLHRSRRFCWRCITRFSVGIIRKIFRWLSDRVSGRIETSK